MGLEGDGHHRGLEHPEAHPLSSGAIRVAAVFVQRKLVSQALESPDHRVELKRPGVCPQRAQAERTQAELWL